MPRDKAATNARIIRFMTEEFLTYGYEKASLNRVSAKVGITTAGLYKHFSGKEDMFSFLVKGTLEDFQRMKGQAEGRMEAEENYSPFRSDWAAIWTDFLYSHYVGVKLLFCCSAGSRYASFEDELIRIETEGNKAYAKMLRQTGRLDRDISDSQWHTLSKTYVHLMLETIRCDMTKEEALVHMHFVDKLLYPGWERLFG